VKPLDLARERLSLPGLLAKLASCWSSWWLRWRFSARSPLSVWLWFPLIAAPPEASTAVRSRSATSDLRCRRGRRVLLGIVRQRPQWAIHRSYGVRSGARLVRAAASSGTPTWGVTVVANCIK
jgi:hypothetical protein